MKVLLSLGFSILLLTSFQQMKYVKTKVNDNISLSLPKDFIPMTEAELTSKFASVKPPVAAYTDYTRTVDFGVNIAFSRWNAEDLEIMKGFYKSNIMGLYDEVQFIHEGIETINERDFAVFEFTSKVLDEEGTSINQRAISKYVRIQYTIVRSKTVLFNFTCPAREMERWAPVAKEIMSSVKIDKDL